jgi:hypothetical protein
VFFVVGSILLAFVNTRRAVSDAGNEFSPEMVQPA